MNRRWAAAIIASTALHLALVLGFRAGTKRAVTQARVPSETATLEFIRVPSIRLERSQKTPPRLRSGTTARTENIQSPVTEPSPQDTSSPVQVERGRDRSAVPGPSPEEGDSFAVSNSPTASLGDTSSLLDVAPRGPSPEVLALVHARLAQGASRCYPPAAQRFHQTGEVIVAFCAANSGVITHTHLVTTSGVALLDSAATECVVPSANPLPPEAASACFRVPVRFGRP